MLNNFSIIIIDESTDARITEALKEAGYKTFSVQEMMAGINDIDVIQLAADRSGIF